jgi:porphobilinogen deaminase
VPVEPPPALARSIEDAIAALGRGESLATASPDTLLAAAERVFRETLKAGCNSRASAVALLAVDALVTYAFERASDDPARIEERAAQAMASLAALTDLAHSSA